MSEFLSDLLRIGKKIVEASELIQAEIDKHSSSASVAETISATEASGVSSHDLPEFSSLYSQHIENGCPNPLKLLTVSEAERLMGCKIANPTTTGEEEYVGCHYGCSDDRSMYVALCVSASMPWDYVKDEIGSEVAKRHVGDEALVAGEMLYVRSGESFFWLYGRGVNEQTVYRIAQHVAAKLNS